MAASVGAGISMGFAEALSDDGSLTGRGTPWIRGTVCGLMTTIGGIGHTLPLSHSRFLGGHRLGDYRGGHRARRDFLGFATDTWTRRFLQRHSRSWSAARSSSSPGY